MQGIVNRLCPSSKFQAAARLSAMTIGASVGWRDALNRALVMPAARSYATTKKVKVNPNATTLDQALPVIKAFEVGRPTHTLEIHIQCHPEKGQPPIRGSIILPHVVKSDIILAVFAEGQKAAEAKEAGADIVGGQDLIEQIKNGTVKFDKCLATPDILPAVAKIARILGPRGLMPTVNKGTVVEDVANAVKHAKRSFDYRADRQNVVHAGIAKVGFELEQVE
ncbi:hypothetical protein EV182_001304, partial [Spiromyces aspiralis]